MLYGYARVSTGPQDHTAQIEALTAAGCERIYSEKASAAAGRKRPALKQAVDQLAAGDVLVVTKLTRLARSAREGLNVISAVLDKGAGFKSLGDPWADTTTAAGRLVVTIFLGVAEWDREMILERTGEGRARAKARGARLGRPPTLSPAQERFVKDQLRNNKATINELARALGVSRSTIVRTNRTAPPADEPPAAWHEPTCAIWQSGAGAAIRCTCGGIAHGARGLQIDVEELTRAVPPIG